MTSTKNQLCPECKQELTDEEVRQKTITCWFCIAAKLKIVGEEGLIPDSKQFGHPNGELELGQRMQVAALRKVKPVQNNTSEPSSDPLSFEERTKIAEALGVDPSATYPTTVITVKGKNDDTYLQLSIRGAVSNDVQKELERWLKNVLELVGTVTTFGPNYAGTLIQMKMVSGEMFLKQ